MRVAHFDCFSGIAGDMALGALLDCGVPEGPIRAALASLGLPIELEVEKTKRCGLACTKVTVHAKDEDEFRFLPDIKLILDRAAITEPQRALALRIFELVAQAESVAHGMPLDKIHFHEVGALDSIADIVGVSVALDLLGVERFTSSSVPPGSGTVKCAHGIMPVPAPGTAELLKGVPLAKSAMRGELTTPTGAAILKAVVAEFTDSPQMVIERVGSGCGTKDFIEQPNITRILVGTAAGEPSGLERDTVVVLETNLDDVPGEVVGHATQLLFAAGALDVWCVPAQMKKSRPGVVLGVIAPPELADKLEAILFRETATFGVRRHTCERRKLAREAVTVETPWGPVAAKRGTFGAESVLTPEYEACRAVALAHGVSLREVYDAVRRAGPG